MYLVYLDSNIIYSVPNDILRHYVSTTLYNIIECKFKTYLKDNNNTNSFTKINTQ